MPPGLPPEPCASHPIAVTQPLVTSSCDPGPHGKGADACGAEGVGRENVRQGGDRHISHDGISPALQQDWGPKHYKAESVKLQQQSPVLLT